jgi:HSP20 family molecular chaperone IbpA
MSHPTLLTSLHTSPSHPLLTVIRLLEDYALHSHSGLKDAKAGSAGGATFIPRFDIEETDGPDATYDIYGELPGAHKDDVVVEVHGDRDVVICGVVRSPMRGKGTGDEGVRVQRMEKEKEKVHEWLPRFGEELDPHSGVHDVENAHVRPNVNGGVGAGSHGKESADQRKNEKEGGHEYLPRFGEVLNPHSELHEGIKVRPSQSVSDPVGVPDAQTSAQTPEEEKHHDHDEKKEYVFLPRFGEELNPHSEFHEGGKVRPSGSAAEGAGDGEKLHRCEKHKDSEAKKHHEHEYLPRFGEDLNPHSEVHQGIKLRPSQSVNVHGVGESMSTFTKNPTGDNPKHEKETHIHRDPFAGVCELYGTFPLVDHDPSSHPSHPAHASLPSLPSSHTPVSKQEKAEKRYLIAERQFGHFHRAFRFSCVIDKDAVTAGLHNGVLHVRLPKMKSGGLGERRRVVVVESVGDGL